jgi:hypothetical protein
LGRDNNLRSGLDAAHVPHTRIETVKRLSLLRGELALRDA